MSARKSTAEHRICLFCGNHFYRRLAWMTNNRGKYCSKQCVKDAKHLTLEERFWEKVGAKTSSGCILWTGKINKQGYGRLYLSPRKETMAHRFSFELFCGHIPDGLFVLHRCDNPPCINPNHLFLGTHQDNDLDRCRKGRTAKGPQLPHTKLTASQVSEIRRLYQRGRLTHKQLGKRFKVTACNILAVVRGKSWKHVVP